MKTIAVYHLKGGVGKTTAAVNIAYLAARTGAPTLLVDLDPQSSATFYFRVMPKLAAGAKLLEKGKKTLYKHLRATDFEDLDLLPGDENLRKTERLIAKSKEPSMVLKRFLQPLEKDYEYVVLDCPPSFSLMAENIFHAADFVITPVIPTVLAARTYEQLRAFLDKKKWSHLRLFAFLSMMDRRKSMHREMATSLKKDEATFLRSVIPYLSDVEKMGIYRQPVPCFSPQSQASNAYRKLWWELEGRMNQPH